MKRIVFLIIALMSCFSMESRAAGPLPHVCDRTSKTANIARGAVLDDVKGKFGSDIDFIQLSSKGLGLTVDYGEKESSAFGVKPVSGAYHLSIKPKEIIVCGYDQQGAFHGLMTLKNVIASSDSGSRIPCLTVNDWPDTGTRGYVEGYHGGTVSHEGILSTIGLLADLKMNEYVYAPKDDPYVGSPDWTMPYPPAQAQMLKEMMDACMKNRIRFIWAVRPDKDFRWHEDDYRLLIGKFEMMYFLGVRSFAVFFDDVQYVDEAEKRALLERIDRDFISKRKGVFPLITDIRGYCVPADKGKASLLDLYGYADRTWNEEDYNPMESMVRAAEKMAPEVKDALLTFMLHTDMACSPFCLEESAHLDFIGIEGYDKEKFDILKDEFDRIASVYDDMSGCSDKTLFNDLSPWLSELSGAGARCRRILECLECYHEGDIPGFWAAYADNLMSDDQKESYRKHPAGHVRLHAFYQDMMSGLSASFDSRYRDRLVYERYDSAGIDVFIAPDEAGSCHLILNNPEGEEVIARLSDASGRYTAEFCTRESYVSFEMKEKAVKLEVIGDVEIFEVIFVK